MKCSNNVISKNVFFSVDAEGAPIDFPRKTDSAPILILRESHI